ncbi:endolytic transglycosylase MltG [Kitasatospora phosalacinea]|uniref:endolytic transglycosylase MltG n=1 Tax=Kitasatospora phosalacinea TaxID=2065 RepID=UPI000691DEBC|nr:endolytic transglycosylase MltG [Kitasatospora phosalacinea]
MTDQSGRYGSQGDQPWYPGEQPQDPYGQQQFVQQPVPGQGQVQGMQGYPQQQFVQQQPVPGQDQGQGQGLQGYPQQQGGSFGGRQQFAQQGYPQQGGSYGGQQQFVQQPVPGQGPFQGVQQGFPPGQQTAMGQGHPQQGGSYGGQQQFVQQQPLQQQAPQQPVQQRTAPQPRSEPAGGPGPDGIDWEAEAAALDAPPSAGRRAEEAGRRVEEREDWAEDEYFEEEDGDESFFSGQDGSREAERKRKEKGKKSGRRNGGACLLVALVLLGGVGGAGWWGYGFYQRNFGPPPDFKGTGTGSVNITVKEGAGGDAIGKALLDAGVVKSIKAFSTEYEKDPRGRTIQPGIYTMKHQMSAAEAFKELVESNGGNALIIPEGLKAADIYTKIDGKLKLSPGTTAKVAKEQVGSLGLPGFANNNLEGFLWPARYSVAEGMKPEELLKQMVANAVQKYSDLKLDEGAQKIGLKTAYEVVTEASILQAEGNNSEDFGKIARVLYNRLNTNATQGKLQLDTTLQYKLGRTNFTTAEKDGDKSPYNTYVNKGLPPTPISNPGEDAIQAVLNPAPGDWVYFVAVSNSDTRFAATFDAFKKDVKDYCSAHNQGFDESAGMCKTR